MQAGQQRWVSPRVGLNLRAGPTASSRRILTLPHNARVRVLERQPNVVKIGGTSGSWVKVSWRVRDRTRRGWVFGAFLQDKPSSFTQGQQVYAAPQAQKLERGLRVAVATIQEGGRYEVRYISGHDHNHKPVWVALTVHSHELTLSRDARFVRLQRGCYAYNRTNFPGRFKHGKISIAACLYLTLSRDRTMRYGGNCHRPSSEDYTGRWWVAGGKIKFSSTLNMTADTCRLSCNADTGLLGGTQTENKAAVARCISQCQIGFRRNHGATTAGAHLKGSLALTPAGKFLVQMESGVVNRSGKKFPEKSSAAYKCIMQP